MSIEDKTRAAMTVWKGYFEQQQNSGLCTNTNNKTARPTEQVIKKKWFDFD